MNYTDIGRNITDICVTPKKYIPTLGDAFRRPLYSMWGIFIRSVPEGKKKQKPTKREKGTLSARRDFVAIVPNNFRGIYRVSSYLETRVFLIFFLNTHTTKIQLKPLENSDNRSRFFQESLGLIGVDTLLF
jgi:hypothetical protein